jgi:hypothetical protein
MAISTDFDVCGEFLLPGELLLIIFFEVRDGLEEFVVLPKPLQLGDFLPLDFVGLWNLLPPRLVGDLVGEYCLWDCTTFFSML